jgi:hypothetical protein
MKTTRLSKARKLDIAHAYVLVTGGVLPTNLEKLLHDMREIMGGDVTEADVRKTIKWALQQRPLPWEQRRRRRPRLRVVH